MIANTSSASRLKALDCEKHAKAAFDPAIRKEWEAIAIRWHWMAASEAAGDLMGGRVAFWIDSQSTLSRVLKRDIDLAGGTNED
jgi:hypothetical protein